MGKDAGTIKQEIAQTRERMGNTVDALGAKADPGARIKSGLQDKVDTMKGAIGDAVDSVKGAVNGATDAASSAAAGVANAGKSNAAVGQISGTLSKLNDGVASKLADTDVNAKTQQALGIAKENPIGLALAALAMGFLTGSLLPVLDVERERLGPIREKVVSQAQAATHDLVEASKAVVAETAQSVVTSALSSAQSHGHEVLEAAKTRAEQA